MKMSPSGLLAPWVSTVTGGGAVGAVWASAPALADSGVAPRVSAAPASASQRHCPGRAAVIREIAERTWVIPLSGPRRAAWVSSQARHGFPGQPRPTLEHFRLFR